MTKTYVLLVGLLTQSVFIYSQEENWDVYVAKYEKGGSTVVNMALKKIAPLKDFPILLKTGVKVNKCLPEGLPEQTEFQILNQISSKIKTVIDSTIKNVPAGTFTYQCDRNDYYYVNDTTNIRQILEIAYRTNFPNYHYTITFREDQKWEAYLSFLYPNDETLEYMSNQKVIFRLTQAGDDLTKPRKVDHWLYFVSESDRDKFIVYATSKKFKIETKQYIKDSKLSYQLQISRVDKVNIESIGEITSDLRGKARELNGDYDGWETFVVK